MPPARIQIIPFIHGKITRDGKPSEPDIYYILERWLDRHPEIKKRQQDITISRGGFTLPEGVRTELVDVLLRAGPDIDGYDASEDADLYEYYLAEDQGDAENPAAEMHEARTQHGSFALRPTAGRDGTTEHDQQKLKLGKGVAFVKSQLCRLPQTEEIWEVDIRPAPAPGNNGTIWEGLVISNDGRLPTERMFEEPANVNHMAQLLADAMRRPLDGEPRRPKTLRIRKRREWAELLPHLRQIGLRVISAPRLAAWDEVFKALCRNASKKSGSSRQMPRIEELYPTIAEFVRTRGHIEIGDQEGIGFVAKALDYGGLVFDGRKVKTLLAEAMSALESGLVDHLERESLGDD
jgi:hypothetical protein